MPTIEKITLTYSEKRSAAYQVVEHGISIEVVPTAGETAAEVIAKYQPALRDKVAGFTSAELDRLIDEARDNRR